MKPLCPIRAAAGYVLLAGATLTGAVYLCGLHWPYLVFALVCSVLTCRYCTLSTADSLQQMSRRHAAGMGRYEQQLWELAKSDRRLAALWLDRPRKEDHVG